MDTITEDEAYDYGREAWIAGLSRIENPFVPGSDLEQYWLDGWNDAALDSSQFGVGA